jgi:hypothetical protein
MYSLNFHEIGIVPIGDKYFPWIDIENTGT